MVIDDETIYFEMDGEDYMIELWKGQYYASTGCEIGLYHSLPANNTCKDDANNNANLNNYTHAPNAKKDRLLYECAYDDEMLHMEYELVNVNHDETPIFKRSGKHWWLTGFKPGVYNPPDELKMKNIKITFKKKNMLKIFKTLLIILLIIQNTILKEMV